MFLLVVVDLVIDLGLADLTTLLLLFMRWFVFNCVICVVFVAF